MNTQPTIRERVLDFWTWFPTVAPAIAKQLQAGHGLDGLDFDFVDEVRERIGGLSWVFGPGESDDRLSFTATGEGQRAKQLLSHFWLSQAVEVPGWDFHGSRQPSPLDQLQHLAIDVGGTSVDAETLLIATEVDEKSHAVNIKAWHEVFSELPDEPRLQILFLMLDEALGEFRTQTKLGDMQIKSDPNGKPLAELPEFLDKLWAEKGWEDTSPLETYSGYRAEPTTGFDRADIFAGYTCVPSVVLEYLNNQGNLDDNPIENTGAEYLFVQIDADVETMDDPLQYRTEVEDEISKRLSGSGYLIGGETGNYHLYIDLVAFDGHRSKAAIAEALAENQLSGKFAIKPFL